MKKEPEWLTKQDVLALHERLLSDHGGAAGLLDEGLLDAALGSPKNHFHYARTDIFDLAAAYACALTRDHPFTDGNKRIALAAAGIFLELNGFRLDAPEADAVRAVLALSSNEMDQKEFAMWLRNTSSKFAARPRRAKKRPPAARKKK